VRADLPSGTVTFLFTDIEGSTRLLHQLGPTRYADALAEHRRIVREAAAAHDGVEVDTQGDAFFLAFPTAGGASAAAQAAREGLAAGAVRVRMGLHTGTPTTTAEGYVGEDVHRGARIAALAHGEQILLSPTAAALLDSEPLCDLGRHRLKDFDGAVRIFQLGEREFPPLRTPGSVDLPTPATPFLGREQELFGAVSLVYERDPRVLTIVGTGGTGKTRFAIELARLLGDEAEGGTVFVPLAPLRDAEFVLPTLADRLGSSSPDPAAIAARIGERRTHVVCDNLEQLLPGAARPLAGLVAGAPALRLIVTSREPLRVQGEAELDLPPLVRDEAVELFCERARAVRRDVTATAAVAELCDRLDRLPLALELAAARTKLLAPEALLERLADRLDALRGTRDAEERHTTLRTTIAWSYDLLDDDEQQLFARLGVFRGGCTLETAETVCDADLDTLASLLDKSLLRRRTGRLGEERYWMLETLREFALEQLEGAGEGDSLRRRHAEHFLTLGETANLAAESQGPERPEIVRAEQDNFRAAIDWAVDREPELAFRLTIALEQFWVMNDPFEGVRRLRTLLEHGSRVPRVLKARALRTYGESAWMTGERPTGNAAQEEALRIFQELGDEAGLAIVLHRLSVAALADNDRDLDRARKLLAACLEICERNPNPKLVADAVTKLGWIEHLSGNPERALELWEEGATRSEEVGFTWMQAHAVMDIADVADELGRSELARQRAREALRLSRDCEDRQLIVFALALLARLAAKAGRAERAGRLWGAIETEESRGPVGLWESKRDEFALTVATPSPEFEQGRSSGRSLSLDEAVTYALGEDR
jgi:predicted ATPase/class 3 adenylate cyclase